MPRLALLLLLLSSGGLATDDWGPAQFLVGRWIGEGSGQPGQGNGAFSFTPDLQGRILVRKSFAEYPAVGGLPASRHDDLMIVYRDDSSRQPRAIYFDSEGHTIRYTLKSAEKGVVFTSEGAPDETRYRLIYTSTGTNTLKLKFEIAPPGKDFAVYLDAAAHREGN